MRKTLAWVVLAAALLLAACTSFDGPPEVDSPEPAPLEGTFSSQYGTMTFNGDGSTIEITLSEELAEAEGIEPGTYTGTYVFTFHNGACRYDIAEALELQLGQSHLYFLNRPGETNAHQISICSEADAGNSLIFMKTVEE